MLNCICYRKMLAHLSPAPSNSLVDWTRSSSCSASCSPARAKNWYFTRWQIPPTVELDDNVVLYTGNTSFLWDTKVIQRLWNSNMAFFVCFLKTWQRYEMYSQVLPAVLPTGCWKQKCSSHFVFLLWGLLFAMFLNSQPTLQSSLPSSGCLGRQALHKQLFVVVPPRSFTAFLVLEFSVTNNLCMHIFTNVKNKSLKIWTCPPKV